MIRTIELQPTRIEIAEDPYYRVGLAVVEENSFWSTLLHGWTFKREYTGTINKGEVVIHVGRPTRMKVRIEGSNTVEYVIVRMGEGPERPHPGGRLR